MKPVLEVGDSLETKGDFIVIKKLKMHLFGSFILPQLSSTMLRPGQ